MERYIRKAVSVLPALALLAACATVPITGRGQLSIVPESTMLSTSFQQYEDFMKKNKVIQDSRESEMVKAVGRRIQKAVEEYFIRQGMAREMNDYRWEFNLVDSKEVNAWAMPGGKVAVYTGILPIAGGDAGLAAIMGHEVAHVVARHGNERMSQALLAQLGGVALSTALASKPETTRELWLQAFGAGAQYGLLLPYSRLQEKEADHLGLIFMAMAGYDPQGAVQVWQRMMEQHKGKQAPEFLSTHPADQTRLKNIRELLPEAMRYYRPSN